MRSYAWGSPTVIPELLGRPATAEPQAELWAGAHPGSPSTVVADGRTLDRYIADDPEAALGASTVQRFGPQLPFLLKILAVQRPLSVQVHPTVEQARQGYAAEDGAGVSLDSPQRSYRDRNHKPEMVVALTEFEALIGFADPLAGAERLEGCAHADLVGAGAVLREPGGLEVLVRRWMTLPDGAADDLVAALTAEAAVRHDDGAFELVARLAREYPGDRGLLLALLMEHVRLRPGEAAFVPAGVPHAYLSGVGVEPQASSDNTLRAGLTAKHVDVAEVLRLLRYEPHGGVRVQPQPLRPGERAYPVPGLEEFLLTEVELSADGVASDGVTVEAPALVLLVEGEASVRAGADEVSVERGRAVFVPAADGSARLRGTGVAFTLVPGSDTAR
ncbi:mannose-6-phosphate isomerase type 1 [Haloactinopolyspora alba]|uniref:mannose-6-phosphate isomerase n=1 Tax=Haloactinopolyspora alba TaxID=648780 RepID=A0A2P8D3A5_9ACTN|nr:mannose-6-phosphate isomerase type 1 [Haloactinopolyspora alba]